VFIRPVAMLICDFVTRGFLAGYIRFFIASYLLMASLNSMQSLIYFLSAIDEYRKIIDAVTQNIGMLS